MATDLVAEDYESAYNRIVDISENEAAQDTVASVKIYRGFKKIKKGLNLIILPLPTWTEEVYGASCIATGFSSIVYGVGEIFEWLEE